MSWRESLAANFTDGVLVLHRGKVVYEQYRGCLAEDGKHAAMSMTKSLTGLLAQILVDASANYGMSVLPMFILMGLLVSHSGMIDGIFNLVQRLTGRLPGAVA